MKRSMILKIESLLSAMVSGKTDLIKEIIRRPTKEKESPKPEKFPFKFLQVLK